MPKYENQNNYSSVPYPSPSLPGATIKSGGCGCVCSVNVLRFFGINVSVADMASAFLAGGIRVNGGTDMNKAVKYLKDTYGLSYIATTDEYLLKTKLAEGCAAIANVDGDEGSRGIFSSAGHFINIIGYDNKPPKPFICFDAGYYDGKFSDAYRKQYVSVSKDGDGNVIQFTTQEALDIDTRNRNPQYWIFENGGELTMTQYEELNERLKKLENPMIYNYIDENTAKVADDANAALIDAVDRGILRGNENGELGLSYDQVRYFIWEYRAGKLK